MQFVVYHHELIGTTINISMKTISIPRQYRFSREDSEYEPTILSNNCEKVVKPLMIQGWFFVELVCFTFECRAIVSIQRVLEQKTPFKLRS